MSVVLTPITHSKGARQPPLFGTLASDDPAFDPVPAGASATFYMREAVSSTMKINGSAAVITDEPGNELRYDWATTDVNSAGFYVAWWRVTLASGQYAETPPFLVWIVDQAAATSAYVSSAELKQTLSIKAEYANADLEEAVAAASRAIDSRCNRTFTLGTAPEARTYLTNSPTYVEIDDLNSLTSVVVDGVAAVSGTDFNAVAGGVGWPIGTLESIDGYEFPTRDRVIVVTGVFGWPAVPPQIKTATKIIASRLLQRARNAAFGVVGLGFEGAAVHIARFDPDLDLLLGDFERRGGSLAQ